MSQSSHHCSQSLLRSPLCILSATAILLTTGCSQKIDTHSEFVQVAYQHERQGEFPEAVVAYRKALELNSKSATTWYDMGVAFAAMEQFPAAIDAYSRAVELDSTLAQAFNNRAAAYARLKQFQRAVDDCSHAIDLTPNDDLAWRNRGLAYHDLGKLNEALADYNESIRINGRTAATYLYRGNLYLERDEADRALEDLDNAIHLEETASAVWLSRAKALASLGRRAAATKSLTKANELGADIAEVVLDDFDPSVAPAAVVVDLDQQAIDFVSALLHKDDRSIQPTEAPWALQDDDAKYVVRLVSSDDRPDILFSRDDLDSIAAAKDASTTLIVVRHLTTADDVSIKSSFRVLHTLPNWTPDRSVMKPLTWSLPLENIFPEGTYSSQVSKL